MYVICHTCGLDINTTASTRTDKSLHLLLQKSSIDLANGKFHILLAKGPLNGENLQFHADKVASEKAITLKEFALIGGASEGWLIQVKKPVSNLSGFPV